MNGANSNRSSDLTSVKNSAALAQFWSPQFVTYRRMLLDLLLTRTTAEVKGTVIDVGGKRHNKRGSFRPSTSNSWWYLNLDRATDPSVIADAHHLPVGNEVADYCICTETIEHIHNPALCVTECHRVLRPGGTLLLSVPFLYPVHSDPYDFQRFTKDGLAWLLRDFSAVTIAPMGGAWGVIGMMIEFSAIRIQTRVLRGPLWRIGRLLQWLDVRLGAPFSESFTTGYFVIASK